jgi:hypothetical protein
MVMKKMMARGSCPGHRGAPRGRPKWGRGKPCSYASRLTTDEERISGLTNGGSIGIRLSICHPLRDELVLAKERVRLVGYQHREGSRHHAQPERRVAQKLAVGLDRQR